MISTAIVGGMRQRVKRGEEQRRKTTGVLSRVSGQSESSVASPPFFFLFASRRDLFSFPSHFPPTAGSIFYLNIQRK